MASSLGVEVSPINVRDAEEIERAVAAFARFPNGGLIVMGGPSTSAQRDLIVALAAQHKLPAVYATRVAGEAPALCDHERAQAVRGG
jgi:putative ABC transport system substrate-binding protein